MIVYCTRWIRCPCNSFVGFIFIYVNAHTRNNGMRCMSIYSLTNAHTLCLCNDTLRHHGTLTTYSDLYDAYASSPIILWPAQLQGNKIVPFLSTSMCSYQTSCLQLTQVRSTVVFSDIGREGLHS